MDYSPEELNEYRKYVADQLKAAGAGTDELEMLTDEYMKDQGLAQKTEPTPMEKLKSMGATALDYTGRAADYVGGLSRATLAAGGEAAGMGDIYRGGDFARAFKGEAPTSSEILKRANIGEGGSLSDVMPSLYSETGEGLALEKGGMFDPTARGAAGFALDIGADPLTYLSLGGTAAAKTLAKTGNAFTRSGVKNVDIALKQKGKRPISDIMIKENIGGSAEQIHQKLDHLSDAKFAERKTLYDTATDAGAMVEADQVKKQWTEYMAEQRFKNSSQAYQKEMDAIEAWGLEQIQQAPGASLDQASNIKTGLRNNIPQSFYNPMSSRPRKSAEKAADKLSTIYQTQIVDAADKASPGLGKQIDDLNKEWGTLIEADSPMSKEARKEVGRNAFTTMDAMYGGAAMMATKDPKITAGLLALKKAADVSKSTGFRTRVGQGFRSAGSGLQKAASSQWFAPRTAVGRRAISEAAEENRESSYAPASAWRSVK